MAGNYGRIDNLDQLKKLVDKLYEQGKPIGFDVETGYLGPDREKASVDWSCPDQFVVGFSFTNDRRWARYVPIGHDLGLNLPEEETWEVMKPLLEDLPVVAHNWKFEAHNVHSLEWKGRGPRIDLKFGGDTMLQGYVIQGCDLPDGGRADFRSFGLKDMVLNAFGHEQAKIQTLFPGYTAKALKCLRFNVLELTPEVISYACEDAAWTIALHELVEPQAKAERRNMLQIEYEICELLTELEEFGMNVAWDEMERERQKAIPFKARMEKAVKAGLGALAGKDLTTMNLGSVKQLKELIYRDLGFATTRLTNGATSPKNAGKEKWELMSTDATAMEGLAKEHPALKKLLEWREVGNALNRFDKWLDENRFADDKRIHPNFNQVIVGTGRFAANDPPVQQMPKEWRFSTKQGLDVWGNFGKDWEEFIAQECHKLYEDYWTGNFRDYVCAPEDHYLLGYDYSQIELRVMAGVSQEPLLLQAFRDGTDVHTLTAAMMLGKPLEQIDKKVDRPIGKTMNFALLYQMGPQSLSERLGISRDRANELYNAYFAQFASITTWMQRARQVGEARGYAETPFGRKYTVWELQSDIKGIRAKGQRVLINAPIQGGAADYMKMAMIRARRTLKAEGLWGTKVKMIHNLHDALVFEVHDSIHPQELRDLLSKAVVFPVKNFPEIVADWELGQRHGSCDEWDPEKGHYPAWNEETGHWEIRTRVEGSVREDSEQDEPTQQITTFQEHMEVTSAAFGGKLAEKAAESKQKFTEAVPQLEKAIEEFEETKQNELKLVPPPKGVDLLVEVLEMPTMSQLQRLVDMLVKRPGPNTLVLRTPQGDVRCSAGTDIDLGDKGLLSMILGGAHVSYAKESIDLDSLAMDISL